MVSAAELFHSLIYSRLIHSFTLSLIHLFTWLTVMLSISSHLQPCWYEGPRLYEIPFKLLKSNSGCRGFLWKPVALPRHWGRGLCKGFVYMSDPRVYVEYLILWVDRIKKGLMLANLGLVHFCFSWSQVQSGAACGPPPLVNLTPWGSLSKPRING